MKLNKIEFHNTPKWHKLQNFHPCHAKTRKKLKIIPNWPTSFWSILLVPKLLESVSASQGTFRVTYTEFILAPSYCQFLIYSWDPPSGTHSNCTLSFLLYLDPIVWFGKELFNFNPDSRLCLCLSHLRSLHCVGVRALSSHMQDCFPHGWTTSTQTSFFFFSLFGNEAP